MKAKHLIKPHNPQFKGSKGWLKKLMTLSLRLRASINQKLPAQLEKKLEASLNEVRVLRTEQSYPFELIINMDKTSMYFDMVPPCVVTQEGTKEVRVRSSGSDKKG